MVSKIPLHRLDVVPGPNRGHGIAVSEAVQWDVFQICVLQNFLVELRYGVPVVHFSCSRRWEHVLVIGMFAMLLD